MSIWHEARKQEKKIRGIMVDHRKRAERRREFYESIRRDPASYLQIHGQTIKVHIDPAISMAADSSLVPWMGDTKNLIDRFDVRAHLDYIPTPADVIVGGDTQADNQHQLTADQECQLNYERFRNLIHNDYLGVPESKVLNQIYLEERCGGQNRANAAAAVAAMKQKSANELKKKLAEKRAAIGFNYNELDGRSGGGQSDDDDGQGEAFSDAEEEEEEIDEMDAIVDVGELTDEMKTRINSIAVKFGVRDKFFVKFSNMDKDDAEKLRIAKELENEKLMFVGRKSRRERKELKQQRMLILRSINYDDPNDHFGKSAAVAAKKSSGESSDDDDDPTQTNVDETKVEFITSFGHSSEEEEEEVPKPEKVAKVQPNKKNEKGKEKQKKKPKDEGNSNLVFGPMLPSAKEITPSAPFKFNSSSSSKRNRQSFRYSSKNGSDDDDDLKAVSASKVIRERTPIQEIYRRGARSSRSLRSTSRSSSDDHRPSRYRHGGRSYRRSSSSSSSSSTERRAANSRRSGGNRRGRRSSRSVSPFSPPAHRRNRSRSRSRRRSGSKSKRRGRSRSNSRSKARRRRSKSQSRSRSRQRRNRSRSRDRREIKGGRGGRSSSRRSKSRDGRSSRKRSRSRQRDDTNSRRRRSPSANRNRKTPPKKPAPKTETTHSVKESPNVRQVAQPVPSSKSSLHLPPPPPPLAAPSSSSPPKSSTPVKASVPQLSLPHLPPPPPPPLPSEPSQPPPIKRYYRHDLAEKDDIGNLSEDDDDANMSSKSGSNSNTTTSTLGKSIVEPQSKASCHTSVHDSSTTLNRPSNVMPSSSMTPQERLRRLMQAQLDKEYKRDKKAAQEKMEKQKQEQIERDEELTKMNRVQERRYRNGHRERSFSRSSSSSKDSDRSSRSPPAKKSSLRGKVSRSRSRSSSRSISPPTKRDHRRYRKSVSR